MRHALPLPLLVLLLAACGSSSRSGSSAALDGEGETEAEADAPNEERIPRSAPLADGGMPPELTCSCAEVTIHCKVSGAFHARADRAECALDLPPRACAVLGLDEGAQLDPMAILDAPLPNALDADDVYELCTAKHEARHTCDDASISACASELSAYDVTFECLGAFATDAKVAHNLEGSLAAAELNACLCAGTPCDVCFARCNSDHPKFGSTCKQAREVYCRARL